MHSTRSWKMVPFRWLLHISILLFAYHDLVSMASAFDEQQDEHQLQSDALICRVTRMHTFLEVEDGLMQTVEQTKCIPIINGMEDDDVYSLDLPDNIDHLYRVKIEKGDLFISIKGARLRGLSVDLSHATEYNVVEIPTRTRSLNEYAFGRRTIAVVRVSTLDSSPTETTTTLKQGLFNNDICFKTQYGACSFDQLNWELGTAGAIDVAVSQNVSSFANYLDLVTAAQNVMKSTLGISTVSGIADRVMFCLPPGTGNWAASAGVNHWRAQFNNDWCLSLSATMHEIGHTLGLLHSNENGVPYADSTGYMSAGHKAHTWPRKCFNGVKNWELGWYSSRFLAVNPITDGPKIVKLATFVDYDKAAPDEPVVLNIADTYYLQYNRAKSFNIDTEEKQNLVTVTEDAVGGSQNRAGLDVGGTFQMNNFKGSGKTLLVEICDKTVGTANTPDTMILSVGMGESVCAMAKATLAPTKEPTASPTRRPTKSPTDKPTDRPTRIPSESPTEPPTKEPTVGPTQAPSDTPTKKPSVGPTQTPTDAPSKEPTVVLKQSPIDAPTKKPTVGPTQAPSDTPSKKPTVGPTQAPTNAPTKEPTVVLKQSPIDAPTKKPTVGPSEIGKPSESPSEVPLPAGRPIEPDVVIETDIPTRIFTPVPTEHHTDGPTVGPSIFPSEGASVGPAESPSFRPTTGPSFTPFSQPSIQPSRGQGVMGGARERTELPSAPPSSSQTDSRIDIPTVGPSASLYTSLPTQKPHCTGFACNFIIKDERTSSPTIEPSEQPASSVTSSPTREPPCIGFDCHFIPKDDTTRNPTISPTENAVNSPGCVGSVFDCYHIPYTPQNSPTFVPSKTPGAVEKCTGFDCYLFTHTDNPVPLPSNVPLPIPSISPANGEKCTGFNCHVLTQTDYPVHSQPEGPSEKCPGPGCVTETPTITEQEGGADGSHASSPYRTAPTLQPTSSQSGDNSKPNKQPGTAALVAHKKNRSLMDLWMDLAVKTTWFEYFRRR